MTKADIIESFNPNDPGSTDAGIFGLPFSAAHSDIVLVPVPWEATVSYGAGTAEGPKAIYDASFQMDLNHFDYPELWRRGIFMDEIPVHLRELSDAARKYSEEIIDVMGCGTDPRKDPGFDAAYAEVNKSSTQMVEWVRERTAYWKSQGKIVGLIGGDHSTPLGYLQTLATIHDDFGVLVIDAHMDFRNAFEGFEYSHASIFYNALKLPQITKMVQVGIRDFCEEEVTFANSQGERVQIYYDRLLQREVMRGTPWFKLFEYIIAKLPQKVYVTVDIDGLDPVLCPNTGTPVPGGLQFEQLAYLLTMLQKSGKEIIGFDLCEVAPGDDEWDGNVGARVLYQLCGMAVASK
jgi:agmatinase